MSRYDKQHIVALVPFVVIAMAILACGEPVAPALISSPPTRTPRSPTSTPVQPTATPTPTPPPRVVEIVQTNPTRFEIIEVSTIAARNCAGPNIVRVQESVSQSTITEITVGTNVGFELRVGGEGGVSHIVTMLLRAEIAASLEAEFHTTEGTEIAKTVAFEVETRPGTFYEYPVLWKEVWTDGYVILENWDGSQFTVPFSVRHSLQGEILDGINVGCP